MIIISNTIGNDGKSIGPQLISSHGDGDATQVERYIEFVKEAYDSVQVYEIEYLHADKGEVDQGFGVVCYGVKGYPCGHVREFLY